MVVDCIHSFAYFLKKILHGLVRTKFFKNWFREWSKKSKICLVRMNAIPMQGRSLVFESVGTPTLLLPLCEPKSGGRGKAPSPW